MQTQTMTDRELRTAILELIADRLEPEGELTPSTPLAALDIDSLDLIELAQALDDELGVLIGAAEARRARTLGDILDVAVAGR